MPPAGYGLYNFRIDARGHVLAVEFVAWGSDEIGFYRDWQWRNLDGDIIESGRVYRGDPNYEEPACEDLRIDARGHIVQISEDLTEQGGAHIPPHWWDLDKNDLGAVETPAGIYDIRLDARGHVVAVMDSAAGKWWDLNGDEVAA